VHDFEEVEVMYLEDAEEYSLPQPNQEEVRILLVTTHNLFQKSNVILNMSRNAGRREQQQLILSLEYSRPRWT
jgi:hypothetical protein